MVTIEISSTDIRLIEVIQGKITKWASRDLEPGTVINGVVSNYRSLGNAVREIMSANDIKGRNVIVSVSSLYSVSRIITVPSTTHRSLTEQTVIEASKAVGPLSPEEAYFSWQAIGQSEANGQTMVVSVPREIIDSEIQALKAGGLKPGILDLRTLALARSINRPDAIILNVDTASYDIIILTGSVAEVLHTAAWQADTLSLEERVEALSSAVTLTTSFHRTRRASALSALTPLFITGPLSNNTALTDRLTDSLPYHIEKFSPPLEHPQDMPIAQFAVNIGLALKPMAALEDARRRNIRQKAASKGSEEVIQTLPDLNLLPSAYMPWRPSVRSISYALALILILGLLFQLYTMADVAMKTTDAARQRYAAANTMLERRKAEFARQATIQESVEKFRSIVSLGGNLVDDIAAIRNTAAGLSVRLGPLSYSKDSITFSCEADSFTTFRQFVTELRNSGRFFTPVVPPEGYPYMRSSVITLTSKR